MLLSIFFAILNAILSFFANYRINFSALDIAPVATIIIAWSGGNIPLNAFFFVMAYAVISPKELRFLWITLPMAMFCGYAALYLDSAAMILLLYHLIGMLSALLLGYFRPKYAIFAVVNFCLNYLIAKIYYLLV